MPKKGKKRGALVTTVRASGAIRRGLNRVEDVSLDAAPYVFPEAAPLMPTARRVAAARRRLIDALAEQGERAYGARLEMRGEGWKKDLVWYTDEDVPEQYVEAAQELIAASEWPGFDQLKGICVDRDGDIVVGIVSTDAGDELLFLTDEEYGGRGIATGLVQAMLSEVALATEEEVQSGDWAPLYHAVAGSEAGADFLASLPGKLGWKVFALIEWSGYDEERAMWQEMAEEEEKEWPKHRIGTAEPPRGAKVPDVDPFKRDLQDSSGRPTAESIERDYGTPGAKYDVYSAYVPLSDLPTPVLAERVEYDEALKAHRARLRNAQDDEEYEEAEQEFRDEWPNEGDTYSWKEFHRRGTFPAPKILVHADGKMEIKDGNHRLTYFDEAGYTHALVWVLQEIRGGGKRLRTAAAKRAGSSKQLWHTTSLGGLQAILATGELRPRNHDTPFVSFSDRALPHGDIRGKDVAIAFRYDGLAPQLEAVEYSESWFEAHRAQATYVAGEGWREQYTPPEELYQPPDDIDEDGRDFWEPEQDDVEAAYRDAELDSFLAKSDEAEWVSKAEMAPVRFKRDDVLSVVPLTADPRAVRAILDAAGYGHVRSQ